MRTKKWLAALFAVVMVIAMLPAAALAGNEVSVTDTSSLTEALGAANDGDTINLAAGTYNVGNLQVNKAVNLNGSGADTVLVGSINYYCGDYDGTIKVSNMTVQAPANNTSTQQAIWWSYNTSNPLDGANLVVENCTVKDYLFAIGVNSSTKNCTLDVSGLTLDNVWCGANVSEGAGNTIGSFGVTSDSSVVYEVQVFGSYNAYYDTFADCQADPSRSNPALDSNDKMPSISAGNWPAVAEVDGSYYGSLSDAVANGNGMEINLLDDITLTSAVEIPAGGANITVNGNGHTVTLGYAGAAFNNSTSVEGLKAGTSLTVNGVDFVGHTEGQADHAVVVGTQGGVTVTLSGCSFTNMYDAVYCNFVSDPAADMSTITIENSTFSNVANYYGVDDGYTTDGRTDKHTFVLSGNTGDAGIETFAVATVNGVGYTDLSAAVAAAGEGDTVKLLKDAELDAMLDITKSNITIDLNGNTITASDSFTGTYDNDKHLIQVNGAENVTIANGSIVTTDANKHGVNLYDATGVVLKDVTIDHTNAMKGAPLVLNNSSATVEGKLDLVVGEHSWYGINIDPKDGQASLTFADDSHVSMTGNDKLQVIQLDGEQANITITGAEDAGLDNNGDGTYGPHTHVYDTSKWLNDETNHWHECACGEKGDVAAHTFVWVTDKEATATQAGSKHQECSVCGYKLAAVEIPATGDNGGNTGDNGNAGNAGNTGDNGNTGNNTNNTTNNGPKTGDNSNITFAVIAMLVACCGVVAILVYNGKIKAAYHGKHVSDK